MKRHVPLLLLLALATKPVKASPSPSDLDSMNTSARNVITNVLRDYARRTQRKIPYTLNTRSPYPYAELYYGPGGGWHDCTELCKRLERLEQENMDAANWWSLQKSYSTSGYFKPEELVVDTRGPSETPYSDARVKLDRLLADRRLESMYRKHVETAVAAYEKLSGKSAGIQIPASGDYPYTQAVNTQRELLGQLEFEVQSARSWDENRKRWKMDAVVSDQEIALRPEAPYPYTEAFTRIEQLWTDRSVERAAKRDFEEPSRRFVERAGLEHTPLRFADPARAYPEQAYPFTYARRRGDLDILKQENVAAARWPGNVIDWSEYGLLKPADLELAAGSETPFLDTTKRMEKLHYDRQVEKECRDFVARLTDYRRGLGQDTSDLMPDAAAQRTFCSIQSSASDIVVNNLQTDLGARRALELIRQAQLKAGETHPVVLPPPDKSGDVPYFRYLRANWELTRKYRDTLTEGLIDDAVEALKRNVKTVRKPFYVYHWGPRASGGPPLPVNDPTLLDRLRDSIPAYFDGDEQVANNRNGFYAAVDPYSSRSYGKDIWSLIRVEMPPRSRFLDSDTIDSNVDHRLQYLNTYLGVFCNDVLGHAFVGHPRSAECNELQNRIVRKLDIDAVLYPYSEATFNGQCEKGATRFHGAFVFTSADRLRPENLRIFSEGTQEARDERLEIARAFRISGMGIPIWKDVSEEAGKSDNPEWRREHLLHCDNGFAIYRPDPVPASGCDKSDSAPLPLDVRELLKNLHQAAP